MRLLDLAGRDLFQDYAPVRGKSKKFFLYIKKNYTESVFHNNLKTYIALDSSTHES